VFKSEWTLENLAVPASTPGMIAFIRVRSLLRAGVAEKVGALSRRAVS